MGRDNVQSVGEGVGWDKRSAVPPSVSAMSTPDDNPYRSPEAAEAQVSIPVCSQAHASFCGQAQIVLCCLVVHACALARVLFLDIRPDLNNSVVAGFLVLSPVIGVAFAVSAVRHRGYANRAVGIIGLLWFGFFIALAIVGP